MRISRRPAVHVAIIIGALAMPFIGRADEPTTSPATAPSTAPAARLSILEPLIGGDFRIDAQWKRGGPLKARETYAWGVGRKFIVAKTYVIRPDGTEYQRYETTFGIEEGQLIAYAFTADGEFQRIPVKVDGTQLVMDSSQRGTSIRQTLDLSRPNEIGWKVAVSRRGGEWQEMMDGVWKRAAE